MFFVLDRHYSSEWYALFWGIGNAGEAQGANVQITMEDVSICVGGGAKVVFTLPVMKSTKLIKVGDSILLPPSADEVDPAAPAPKKRKQ